MPELNAEQIALQKAFREFAQKEIKPVAMEREKIEDPAEAFPVELFKKSFDLDLHTSCIPQKYGGMGLDALSHVVIWEELAAADAGFCVSYEGHVTALAFWMNSAPEEHLENFIRPFAESKEGGLVAVATTEPNVGPSWPMLFPNEFAMETTAVLDGDEWVLNGNKNFCTNGGTPLTKWHYVYARTDMENTGMDAHAGFAIPDGTPGFKFGPPEHKMGQRLSYNASFFMDNVFLTRIVDTVYTVFYYPALILFGIWAFTYHRQQYVTVRNIFLVSAAIAFTCFAVFPVAPPRMLPELGFIDSMAEHGLVQYESGFLGQLTNPYAAMPSCHFAWTLLIGTAILLIARSWWLKIVGIMLPLGMLMSIVATANHFILDAVAGAVLIGLSACIVKLLGTRRKETKSPVMEDLQ